MGHVSVAVSPVVPHFTGTANAINIALAQCVCERERGGLLPVCLLVGSNICFTSSHSHLHPKLASIESIRYLYKTLNQIVKWLQQHKNDSNSQNDYKYNDPFIRHTNFAWHLGISHARVHY